MTAEVLQSGAYTCIVDLGRYRFRKYGVPVSGAMDTQSFMSANSLVGNQHDHPAIECYLSGFTIKVNAPVAVGIAGAQADIYINDVLYSSNRRFDLAEGDILKIGRYHHGARVYMSLAGQFKLDHLLDSYSYLQGYLDTRLKKRDILQIDNLNNIKPSGRGLIQPGTINIEASLVTTPSPEWNILTEEVRNHILSTTYTIDQLSDRTGYRLKGLRVKHAEDLEIFSAPVTYGTVQLLPNGLPLILMKDCQTTGGYPRILQLNEASVIQLAQRKPGDTVKFNLP